NEEKKAYFYLRVKGEILAGVRVPTTRAMNEPSYSDNQETTESGEIVMDNTPLPVETNQDTIYIFLDTVPSQGYNVRDNFYAENMIEIKGQNGGIHSSKYFEFDGETSKEWKWKVVKDVDAASGLKEIEVSVDAEPLNVCFHMVDWDGNEDIIETVNLSFHKTYSYPHVRGDYPLVVYGYVYDTDGITALSGLNVSIKNMNSNKTLNTTTSNQGKYQVTFSNFTVNDTIKLVSKRGSYVAVTIGYAPQSGVMQLNATFPVLVNEVMFNPEGNDSGKEWIELYNPGNSSVNLSGYKVVNKNNESFTIQNFTLTNESYVVIYFTSGTNNTTAIFTGTNITFLNNTNESLMLNNSNIIGIDFLCWGGTSELEQIASNNGIWVNGTYISLSGYDEGDSLARDKNSTDTNTIYDWNVSCGKDSNVPTPEIKNIPEFILFQTLILFMSQCIVISRTKKYFRARVSSKKLSQRPHVNHEECY
ncbi:MAG: lamin tail domain-containing protein, partial [Thermoplasmata archaeon]|nr:lamin tail domain-containing protein [Thermoplasmata archaeon]